MKNEIERKFLIKEMPNLDGLKSLIYERYYVYRDGQTELRVQKKGGKYELERKSMNSNLSAEKLKIEITEGEFDKLKKLSSEVIERESYLISSNPEISIKIYHGKFEGFKRVEVEFESEDEANGFQLPDWFGEEITNSEVSRDSKLLDLSSDELGHYIN